MMVQFKTLLKKSILSLLIIILTIFYPAAALADTDSTPPSGTDSTASSSQQTAEPVPDSNNNPDSSTNPDSSSTTDNDSSPHTGPTTPPGADSNTYHYNEATGKWENDYYIWDPATNQTQPKTPQDYSYNPDTGKWDTTEWRYDAPSGKYVPNVVSSPNNPAAKSNSSAGPSNTNQSASPLALSVGIGNTGPNNNSSIDINNNANGFFNLFNNVQISHNVTSSAHSGDANVIGNTLGGNAGTGDATVIANILNLLQSSWGPNNMGDIGTFVANIDGDVVGDLVINPNQLGNSQLNVNNNSNLTINASANNRIDNNVDLDAGSGNATVSDNNQAGDATTGNAKAVANVVNMINSMIKAGKSFVGVLNINGTLDGDILLPPGLLDALIAGNGPNANTTITATTNNNVDANFNNRDSINNNILTSAHSGTADVSNNTIGGNATTGNSDTNITLLNLTGHNVVAKDALLVFVNVLGRWVGLIMNAPSGTTAAALGGGMISSTTNNNLAIDANTTNTINNNIKANAVSGNASVQNNTKGGNAHSGDASASANVANLIDSQLSLSDWFGVLFINVFGDWVGSFGVNTAAGNHQVTNTAAGGMGGGSSGGFATAPEVFQFVPKSKTNSGGSSAVLGQSNGNDSPVAKKQTAVSSLSTIKAPAAAELITHRNNWLVPAIALLAAILLLGGERFLALLRRSRQAS